MPVQFRSYTNQPFFTDDYLRVREFLIRLNREVLTQTGFTWGRWEWMITHGMLDRTALGRIGLWEDDGTIVALATYESELGDSYFMTAQGYEHLKPAMLEYARKSLSRDGRLRVMIDNGDRELQRIARRANFVPTCYKEEDAILDIDGGLTYRLPEGFAVTSMAEGWDFHKYNRCMWRGFNHEGEPDESEAAIAERRQMLSSPTIRPELVVAVTAPDGEYVSHCGMWYNPGDTYALVEPVATVPRYRRMGLGRAAVLEACIRCGRLGAREALVGSSQQFYYSIGFAPAGTGTWWEGRA